MRFEVGYHEYICANEKLLHEICNDISKFTSQFAREIQNDDAHNIRGL